MGQTPHKQYSDNGLALTKSFESLRLAAYLDGGMVWTIGYGHTGSDVHPGQRISYAEAELLLRGDLAETVACVNSLVTFPLTQSQFDALVDFTFNVGSGNFSHSDLLHLINHGEMEQAAVHFSLWVHDHRGVVEPGLVRRRVAEVALFRGTAPSVTTRPGALTGALPPTPTPQGAA